MKKIIIISCFLTFLFQFAKAQNSSVVYLNKTERSNLQTLYTTNVAVKQLCDSIIQAANGNLSKKPKPVSVIYYEGLLENNPDRIKTKKSLLDIDVISSFVYAYYCTGDEKFLQQIKKYVTAWAAAYRPDGNTINENKFIPLFWGYLVSQPVYGKQEKAAIESWITEIAQKQIEREKTPNNNWMAKRHRLIGVAGVVTGNQAFVDFASEGFKEYINTSYFEDGSSLDLKTRDAMHYHFGGIKTVLDALINLSQFSKNFELFYYSGTSGSSMSKTIEFTFPYATGEKGHKEWVNTKVELDKKRAAAGLAEYQPGIIFDKREAIPLFEYACFFDTKYYRVLSDKPLDYTATWIGFLNSPLIRKEY